MRIGLKQTLYPTVPDDIHFRNNPGDYEYAMSIMIFYAYRQYARICMYSVEYNSRLPPFLRGRYDNNNNRHGGARNVTFATSVGRGSSRGCLRTASMNILISAPCPPAFRIVPESPRGPFAPATSSLPRGPAPFRNIYAENRLVNNCVSYATAEAQTYGRRCRLVSRVKRTTIRQRTGRVQKTTIRRKNPDPNRGPAGFRVP